MTRDIPEEIYLLPPKNALPRDLVKKNLTLTLAKTYKKLKQIVFLLMTSAFYESNLQ